MLSILIWIIFGLVVGSIAKLLHPGDEPVGCFPTVAIGVAGSFVGGAINWVIGMGAGNYAPAGLFMSIIGGVICCMLWRLYVLKTSPSGPKSFFTGKKLR